MPLCGGLLLGLATFQAEFDFGVPQFRFVFQPILIMLAAGVGLVAARVFAGRGAALGAVAFFLAVRGALALLVGPILGETTPHMPLFVVEALVVEAVALRVRPGDRPLAFGLWAGAGIGTLGLASEWAWSHAWMPLPWPSELLPEAALLGFAAAIAGALLGAWAGSRLALTPAPGLPALRRGAVLGAAGVAALVAFSLYKPADDGVRAQVALTDVRSGPERDRERRRAPVPRRRRRRRRVADRHGVAGRRPAWWTGCAGSAPAATAAQSRSRCTATGRRWSACITATR